MQATTTSEAGTSTAAPTPATPSTPKSASVTPHSKISRANSTYSVTSRNSRPVGFATVDEDSDEDDAVLLSSAKGKAPLDTPSKPQLNRSSNSDSNNLDMTAAEIRDMEYVASHIGDNDEDYDPMFLNILSEAVKSSRAQSPVAKKVLEIIRQHHNNSKLRTVKDALGIESGIVDVSSPIVQWVMNEATM